jgi:hypothetical protein
MIILSNYFPMTQSIPNNVSVNNLQYIILDKQFKQNYVLQVFIAFLETMQRKQKHFSKKTNCEGKRKFGEYLNKN